MKTKEEVIKDAWGVVWFIFNKKEKEQLIKNNGYYKGYNDDVLETIYHYEHLFDFIADKGNIPYSLEGIDDNNGWVSINNSLPTKVGYYIMYDGIKSILIELNNTTNYDTLKDQFLKDGFTHYQPILKPKSPLHK